MLSREDIRIDTRALAVLRIGLGVLLIADILLRSRNFWYYYTDHGVLPWELVSKDPAIYSTASFPIWEITSHSAFVAVIFGAAFIAGILLVGGYKTRFVTVIAFLLVCAMDARNPYVLSYADNLFHFLFLWAIFLPLGERWSIDALNRDTEPRTVVESVWAAVILLQMIGMYLMNGFHKLQPNWSWSWDVTPMLFSLDHVTYSHTGLIETVVLPLEITSYGWLVLMLASPLLLFLRGHYRTLFVVMFMGAHIAMALTLRIGAFPYVAVVGLALFVSPETWTLIERYTGHIRGTSEIRNSIENHAGNLGQRLEQIEPSKEVQRTIRVRSVQLFIVMLLLTSVFIGAVFVGNQTGTWDTEHSAGEYANEALSVVGVHQPSWEFYASEPPFETNWYVFPAVTENGTYVDVFNERELSWDRPYEGSALNKQFDNSYRDRFFWGTLTEHGYEDDRGEHRHELRNAFVDHVCDTQIYNGEQITHVTMYRVNEEYTTETRLDRGSRSLEFIHIGDYSCGDKDLFVVADPPGDSAR